MTPATAPTALTDAQNNTVRVDWLYRSRHELAKWHKDPEYPDNRYQFIFGVLVQLALPHVEHYHSDLYHDALLVHNTEFRDGTTLYYTVGSYGTHLSDNLQHILWAKREHLYKLVTARSEKGVWEMEVYSGTITPVHT